MAEVEPFEALKKKENKTKKPKKKKERRDGRKSTKKMQRLDLLSQRCSEMRTAWRVYSALDCAYLLEIKEVMR